MKQSMGHDYDVDSAPIAEPAGNLAIQSCHLLNCMQNTGPWPHTDDWAAGKHTSPQCPHQTMEQIMSHAGEHPRQQCCCNSALAKKHLGM